MKFNLLKTMLVAFGMVAGVSGVWAEECTLTPKETTVIQADGTTETNADVVLYKADATAWRCSQAQISSGAFKNMLAAYAGTPVVITKIDASEILEGKMVQKATLTFNSKCTVAGKNSNVQIASIGTEWDATTATWNNTNKSEILNAVGLNGDGVNVSTSTKTLTQDVTELLQNDEDKIIGFAVFTFTGREQEISNIKLTIEAVDASASSTYTIKYVDANGNELKDSDTRSEIIGAAATVADKDKESIYNDDKTKKYIYASDDSDGKTVAEDASTVITVIFREAAIWSYTINYVDGSGNTLGSKEGTNFEQETFEVAYPAYFEADGTIYKSSKLSSDRRGYYFSITLNEDNLTKDVKFSASNAKNVVYFSEAEDIEGLTLTNNNNTFVRSSNGASAYAKDGDVVFTTLPAGKYKLTTVICDVSKNAGSVWHFKAGDDVVFEYTADEVNWAEGTSDEFTLYADTEISLGQGGGSNVGVDLIYIQKTGEATVSASVNDYGFATFCPTVGVSFAGVENVEAYKAAVNVAEGVVNLTKVETVAAGEGVLLRSVEGGAANVELALAADAEENVGNEFIGVTEDIELLPTEEMGKTNYILNNGSQGVGFYLAAGQSVAAGKAYLAVEGVSEAKTLKVVFGGDTTGISEVNATKADGAYYSVSGVRVANPTKGLYIMNGKKVIVK